MAEENKSTNSAETRSLNRFMGVESVSNTILHGRWLALARAVWIVMAIMTLALFVASIPLVFEELSTVALGEGTSIWQLGPDEVRAWEQLGLSVGLYAMYWIVIQVVFVLGFAVVAGVIFWRKSDDWLALFASLFLLMFGTSMVMAVPVPPTTPTVWYWSYKLIQDLVFISTPLFFFLFPDGRFIPRWMSPLAVGWIAFGLFKRLLPIVSFQAGDLIVLGILGLGALAQIYRYRRVSNAAQRQQTKWVVFGFGLTFVVFTGIQLLFLIFPWLRQPDAMLYRIPALTVILLSLVVLPLTIGLAILRDRLWDIDMIIRRTLIYTVLTVMLGLVYFSSVVAIQQLFTTTTGQESAVAVVISTLLIAALFTPLRRRVQTVIDRRFFRRKYDIQQVLTRFAATARNETDVDRLTAELILVVQESMRPAYMSLWFKRAADRKETIVRAVNGGHVKKADRTKKLSGVIGLLIAA